MQIPFGNDTKDEMTTGVGGLDLGARWTSMLWY
jgi:hypothetical protein